MSRPTPRASSCGCLLSLAPRLYNGKTQSSSVANHSRPSSQKSLKVRKSIGSASVLLCQAQASVDVQTIQRRAYLYTMLPYPSTPPSGTYGIHLLEFSSWRRSVNRSRRGIPARNTAASASPLSRWAGSRSFQYGGYQ